MSKIYEALLQAELDRISKKPGLVKNEGSLSPFPSATHVSAAREAVADVISLRDPMHDVALRSWQPKSESLPVLRRRSNEAEQFRNLRAKLYEYRAGGKLKTVLVSSGLPQEGKSFVAANLAIALAQQKDTRVLLVDGDLRRFSLSGLLGAPHEPGLSDYFLGAQSARAVMQRRIEENIPEEASLKNLTFVAAGEYAENVEDLAAEGLLKMFLDEVEGLFDWVIVDSSPVNIVSDALHFSRACDGILLVVRSGVTTYESAKRAQSELQGANILGVVLNGSTEKVEQSYYGYGVRESA